MAKLVDRESLKAFRQANDERYAKPDGNYPTLTTGLADNLTPYSEDSGASQENPFISNGTGTNNNTEIVTVGDYGLLKEKQANTLVVNQLFTGFVNTTDVDVSITASNNGQTATFSGTANNYRRFTYLFGTTLPIGTKLLINMKITNPNNVAFGYRIRNASENDYGGNTQLQIYTLTKACDRIQFYTGASGDYTGVVVTVFGLTNLTQMFNGNIPQDLLDNPTHFSLYYNGDLSYNTGTLVNANGVKLVSTGRQQWDEEYIAGGEIQSDGSISTGYSNRFASKNYIPIIPNADVYFRLPYSISSYGVKVAWYDKNKNLISVGKKYSNIQASPKNACFMRFGVDASYGSTTYNHDITISLYYSPAQGGEGYNKYYPYKAPYIVDTGSEVLRSAGSVKDYKEPNGTIHRLVGTRAYQSGDENDSSLLTDGTTTNYPLETPTTEQGTPFAENLPINDYGMLYWLDENDNLVGIPQGAKIFYPTNYKGFVDDMYSRVDGDSSKFVIDEDLVGYVKQVDLSSEITDVAGLTYQFKKAYKIGNVVTITIFANASSNVSAGSTLFTLSSNLMPANRFFAFGRITGANTAFELGDNSIQGKCSCQDSMSSGSVIKLVVSYAVA